MDNVHNCDSYMEGRHCNDLINTSLPTIRHRRHIVSVELQAYGPKDGNTLTPRNTWVWLAPSDLT
jgi:hypothetical protein